MIKLLLSVAFATALTGSMVHGQTSTSSTTVSTGVNPTETTMTTTTESVGTVMEYAPGQTLVLQTKATEPVHYKFGKTVEYVNAHGQVIEASKIRKDSKVRVHYIKDGDDIVVDKVIVTRNRY